MNYLAHLLLAENNPDSQIGNFLGDFVKGYLKSYQDVYSQKILEGIRNHREIDTFTDKHPIYIQSKRRITNSRSRFAGIIIDIVYDHFLARNWHDFYEDSLENFINKIYITLQTNQDKLPPKLQKILPIMIEENWLLSYREIDGIALTFNRLSKRFKKENTLMNSEEELLNNYQELEEDFRKFFPHVLDFSKNKNYLQ